MTEMNSNGGLEKIASNADIITQIYKLLNFSDQLRLAQVNADFGFIFKEFIVMDLDYSSLNIIYGERDYIVANETNTNRKLLTRTGLQEFKSVYADNVHELNFEVERDVSNKLHKDVIMKCISGALFCGKSFINLKSLQCTVPHMHSIIPVIAKNVPHLKSLHLTEFVRKNTRGVGKENVKCLLEMKNLKQLCLNYRHKAKLKYQHFCQLIYELQLEVLEGTLIVVNDNCKNTGNLFVNRKLSLKELRILTTFIERNSLNHNPTFLKIFENLAKVHLEVTRGLNETIWAALINSCKNLINLTIKWTKFENITTFSIPSTVTKLQILECRGLTHNNLRQILTETNITEFISRHTHYSLMQEFEDNSISPLIEKLDVDALDLCKFTSIYKQNETLKHLNWYHDPTERSPVSGYHLPSCTNLETLEMPQNTQMRNYTVLQLKHLRKLSTSIESECVWSDICALLRHPPLRELNILCCPYDGRNDAPIEGFPTEVTTLGVTYNDSGNAFDFFLDLFRQNRNLQLSILCPYDCPKNILKLLITSKNFPTYLKEIQICGFKIDCSDLRKNFDDVLKNVRCPPRGEGQLNHIILCRKQIGNVPGGYA